MKVLFDTNVVLDLLLDRTPFSLDAAECLSMVELGEVEGWLRATNGADTPLSDREIRRNEEGPRRYLSLAVFFRNRPSGQESLGKRAASAVRGL